MKSANRRNIRAVFPWILFPISFFTLMIVISVAIGWSYWNKGTPLIWSCLLGSFLGFFVTWLPTFIIWRIFLYITRGVPFRDGQLVEITNGQHKGATGIVVKRDSQQAKVLIQLHTDSDGKSISHSDWFDWLAIRRLKLKPKVR